MSEYAHQHVTQVLEQVPTVSDLNGSGSAQPRSFSICLSTVAANDLNAGMSTWPVSECVCLSPWKDVHHIGSFQVHQECAIAMPAPYGPIIYP